MASTPWTAESSLKLTRTFCFPNIIGCCCDNYQQNRSLFRSSPSDLSDFCLKLTSLLPAGSIHGPWALLSIRWSDDAEQLAQANALAPSKHQDSMSERFPWTDCDLSSAYCCRYRISRVKKDRGVHWFSKAMAVALARTLESERFAIVASASYGIRYDFTNDCRSLPSLYTCL